MISSIKALKYQDLLTKDKWNFPLLAPKLFKSKSKMFINWETTFFMLWKDLIVDKKNISYKENKNILFVMIQNLFPISPKVWRLLPNKAVYSNELKKIILEQPITALVDYVRNTFG